MLWLCRRRGRSPPCCRRRGPRPRCRRPRCRRRRCYRPSCCPRCCHFGCCCCCFPRRYRPRCRRKMSIIINQRKMQFYLKSGLKGTKILKFHIFGKYVDFFSFNFDSYFFYLN